MQSGGGDGGDKNHDQHHHHHHSGGACNCAQQHEESQQRGLEFSLYKYVDTPKVTCLNATNSTASGCVFKPFEQRFDASKFVESNPGSHQLILHVPFTGSIKLKSFVIIGGEGGCSPAHLKLFSNRDDIDFDNCSRLKPVQEFDLPEDRRGEVSHETRIVKFTGVQNLTFFFDKNYSAPITRIYFIGLKGEYTPLARNPVIAAYELRPQPSDHKNPAENRNLSGLSM